MMGNWWVTNVDGWMMSYMHAFMNYMDILCKYMKPPTSKAAVFQETQKKTMYILNSKHYVVKIGTTS